MFVWQISVSETLPDSKLEYKIVPATWRDLGDFRHLLKVCFPKDAWPLLEMIAVVSLRHVVRLKAVTNGQIVGFIAGEHRFSDGKAWIATLGVLPEYRRRGIATALLQACEEQMTLPRIRLTVRVENYAARQLYEEWGYQQIGIWKKYYRGETDALLFEKVRS